MNYEIKLSDSGKYVIVSVNSDMTRALAEQVGLEATHLAKKIMSIYFCMIYETQSIANL